jgi:hypothetical protein
MDTGRRISGQWWRTFLRIRGTRIWTRWGHSMTDNIGCTVSFWWRGQGRRLWCFHPRNAQTSSINLDINVSGRCYRQKHRTTTIQSLDDTLRDLFPWDIELVIDAPWWERRGTGSPSSSVDCCYSNLLDLLRVKTRVWPVWSYNLWTSSLSFPSQLTLVKFVKLKRTQSVCTKKKRKRERKREKTERIKSFFWKKMNSHQKLKNKIQNCPGTGSRTVVSWCSGTRVRI